MRVISFLSKWNRLPKAGLRMTAAYVSGKVELTQVVTWLPISSVDQWRSSSLNNTEEGEHEIQRSSSPEGVTNRESQNLQKADDDNNNNVNTTLLVQDGYNMEETDPISADRF